MKKAYGKDILRSIWHTRKRFLSIMAITALGVTVLTGIYAACQDMYASSDRFYDEQKLFDIRIVSTLGLTGEDVEALRGIEGIEAVSGVYSGTVDTMADEAGKTVQMTALNTEGLNLPYIVEGALPSAAGEIAVTQGYLNAAGKKIGDTVKIEEALEEDESAHYLHTVYTITAAVIDPMDISNSELAFRSTGTAADYTFFVTQEDVDSDIYTSISLTLDGTREYDCYSEQYEERVAEVIRSIETGIKAKREEARFQAVKTEAREKIEDADAEAQEEFAKADKEFSDAWEEITDSKAELADGGEALAKEERSAQRQIADAREEIAGNRQKLEASEAELVKGEQQLTDGRKELEAGEWNLRVGRQQLQESKKKAAAEFAAAEQGMAEKQAQLDGSRTQLQAGLSQLTAAFGLNFPAAEWNALAQAAARKTAELAAADPAAEPDAILIAEATSEEQQKLTMAVMGLQSVSGGNGTDYLTLLPGCIQNAVGMGMTEGGQQVLDAGKAVFAEQKAAAETQLAEAEGQLAGGQSQVDEGFRQLESSALELAEGRAKLEDGKRQLADGEEELNRQEAKAVKELADAREELADGSRELADGEAELSDKQADYLEEKAEAQQELADAYKELEELDMTEWYVQDRDSLDSYSSLKSDMSAIASIAGAFPVVFLVVAILISLTTMTRMVEEERGLIGTYKALGFGNGAIYSKYVLYAFLACLLGGIVGDIGGFVALPRFLVYVLSEMYILPEVRLSFDLAYGTAGMLLFMAGIVGATVIVCRSELSQMPAVLMRPKAPRNGSRVFLERFPFVWNRLKFLNKVTVRNLFRYKKRFFMTVFGIMGCTALVLAGFAIKDSVTALLPGQYEDIYRYDLMAVTDTADSGKWEALRALVQEDANIQAAAELKIDSFKLSNEAGSTENVQLMVVPDAAVLEGYINLTDSRGEAVTLDDAGILVTENAAQMLGLEEGDTVTLQNLKLEQSEASVSGIIMNYLGNNVFMTKSLYERLMGEYAPNGILARLSDICEDRQAYAQELLESDIPVSVVSVDKLKEDFSSKFALINAVVYVIIILAAGLAFVVLFTLSGTNISERARELATTKVLGFYDSEVHAYVNKETLLLTALGILAGLPVGRFLSGLLTSALKMPSIYFAVHVETVSYVYAAVISFCFALAVNLMTNRTLNRIDMVEALKSVE